MKETKQERRGRRRAKEKAKMPQHARSLARVYKDAVSKRAGAVRIHTRAARGPVIVLICFAIGFAIATVVFGTST
jgi:hypothetical protein